LKFLEPHHNLYNLNEKLLGYQLNKLSFIPDSTIWSKAVNH